MGHLGRPSLCSWVACMLRPPDACTRMKITIKTSFLHVLMRDKWVALTKAIGMPSDMAHNPTAHGSPT